MMKNELETLRTLAEIVGKHRHPNLYQCTPREMILHAKLDWAVIQEHLYELEKQEYVAIAPTVPISFSITEKGIKKVDAQAGRTAGIKQFIFL